MEGRCTKCGTLYHIGVLEESFGSQVCPYCGAALEIKNDSGVTFIACPPAPSKENRVDQTKTFPTSFRAEMPNANNISGRYDISPDAESPYISGLQKAIGDFRKNK